MRRSGGVLQLLSRRVAVDLGLHGEGYTAAICEVQVDNEISSPFEVANCALDPGIPNASHLDTNDRAGYSGTVLRIVEQIT